VGKEKEILDKELSFNYGDELDKIQNHISTLRFVAISSVNSLEEQDKEIERLNNKEEQLIRRLEDLIIVGEQVENEWAVGICKMVINELRGDKE